MKYDSSFLTYLPTGLIELKQESRHLEVQVQYRMSQLTTQVKRRDKLRHRRERQYNLITAILQASSQKRSKTYFIIIIYLSVEYAKCIAIARFEILNY